MVLPECLLVCWDPSLDWGHCCALPCCAPPCLFTSYAVFFFFCLRSCLINLSAVRPVTMETRCFHKKLEFQRYPPKYFCTARYERKSSKKSFKLFKKVSNLSKTPKKIIPGPILGQDRPEKNSAKCLFEAARFRVLARHRATKPTTAP